VGGLTLGADSDRIINIRLPATYRARDLSALIVRKEPKKHGTMSYLEGPILKRGLKVAVVEDVVTSGASLLRAVDRHRGRGLPARANLTILDRTGRWKRSYEDRGFVLAKRYSQRGFKYK